MSRHHLWARVATLGCLAGAMSCAPQVYTPDDAPVRAAWAVSMHQAPPTQPGGCFTADYPSIVWREVPCVTPKNIPMIPRASTFVIGNNDDVAAQAPSGAISQTIGTFENTSSVTSESGPIGNSGPSIANAYTLQINTNFMSGTSACSGSPNPGCQAWEQFLYENDGSSADTHMQYWLIKYNTTCPDTTWNTFSFTGSTDIYCWKNSKNAASVPNQVIANIANWSFSGTATSTGDSSTMNTGSSVFTANGDNAVTASNGWTIANSTSLRTVETARAAARQPSTPGLRFKPGRRSPTAAARPRPTAWRRDSPARPTTSASARPLPSRARRDRRSSRGEHGGRRNLELCRFIGRRRPSPADVQRPAL